MTGHFFWNLVADSVNPLLTLATIIEIFARVGSGNKSMFLFRCITALGLSLLIVRLGFHTWIDLIGALVAGSTCVLLIGRITARQVVLSKASPKVS